MYMNRGSSVDLVSMPIDIYRRQLARAYPKISSQFSGEEPSLQLNDNANPSIMNDAFAQILPFIMCDWSEKNIAQLASTCKLFARYATNERNVKLYRIKKNLFCKFVNRRLRQLEDKAEKERKENHEEIVVVLQQALEQDHDAVRVVQLVCAKPISKFMREDLSGNIVCLEAVFDCVERSCYQKIKSNNTRISTKALELNIQGLLY